VNVWDLWPAAALIAITGGLGVCLGFMADAWLSMREIRAANRGDRVPR
jgi:hypothetical protein